MTEDNPEIALMELEATVGELEQRLRL